MSDESLAILHMFVCRNEVCSQVALPNKGDTFIRVFPHGGDGKYLLAIPDFCWSSNVSYFDDLENSVVSFTNYFYENYVGGYCRTMGDISLNVPDLQPHLTELKLIFSMMLSYLYKHSGEDDYDFKKGTAEKHIRYCQQKLTDLGIYFDSPQYA